MEEHYELLLPMRMRKLLPGARAGAVDLDVQQQLADELDHPHLDFPAPYFSLLHDLVVLLS